MLNEHPYSQSFYTRIARIIHESASIVQIDRANVLEVVGSDAGGIGMIETKKGGGVSGHLVKLHSVK